MLLWTCPDQGNSKPRWRLKWSVLVSLLFSLFLVLSCARVQACGVSVVSWRCVLVVYGIIMCMRMPYVYFQKCVIRITRSGLVTLQVLVFPRLFFVVLPHTRDLVCGMFVASWWCVYVLVVHHNVRPYPDLVLVPVNLISLWWIMACNAPETVLSVLRVKRTITGLSCRTTFPVQIAPSNTISFRRDGNTVNYLK